MPRFVVTRVGGWQSDLAPHDVAMLVCEDAAKTFYDPGRGPVHAVCSLDLRCDDGVVALLGANGAGKSTLLRMIATLLVPDRGRILVDGHDTAREALAVRRRIGYLSTSTRCYPRLSAREMLRYAGSFHGLGGDDLDRRIVDVTRRFGLEEILDQRCSGLSTGQTQRVNLARTLLVDPPLLVLDEPTTGLDIAAAHALVEAVAAADRPGRLILYCTHILTEVARLASRVLILRDGALVFDDDVAALQREGDGDLDAAVHRHIGTAAEPAP